MGKRIDMCGFSREESAVHKATTAAVVLLYVFVASTIDLFHKDECQLAPTDTAHKDADPNAGQCPACKFLAGHSSTGDDHGPALVSTENIFISHFMPRVTVVLQDDWVSSIISRGPPLTTLS